LAFIPNEPKADKRALAGGRIDQVHGVLVEEVMAFAAHVADLGDEAVSQFLLHHEVVVVVREVLAMAVDGLGAEELVGGVEEGGTRG
jgi:hypothetical protein